MMNKIEMKINNNRTMQLTQQSYDSNITLTTYDNKSSLVDGEGIISPEDMTMLINYYRYVKSNNIQCAFINPNPKGYGA